MINGNEFRHHRIVKRLRALIRVVGDDEGSKHSEECNAGVNDWRRCSGPNALSNQGETDLTENGQCNGCCTSKQCKPNHPWLSSLSGVRDCAEDWNGYDDETGCHSIRDSVERVGVSEIRD